MRLIEMKTEMRKLGEKKRRIKKRRETGRQVDKEMTYSVCKI